MREKDALRIKLEEFIRKYYKNQLVKGLIYGIGLSLSYLFLVTLVEWAGRFPSGTRLVLLVVLLVGLLGIIGYYILFPLAKLAGIGRRLTYERAAKIIGKHFPEIDDKITNTLQLQSTAESDLVKASIQQRIESLKPFSFQTAIDLGENKKYWPIVAVPVLIFLGVLVTGFWEDFSASGKRIAAYDREFVPEAPFDFILENEKFVVEQGEDLRIKLGFAGKSLPVDASIVLSEGENRMTRNGDEAAFEYTFENVQESFRFYLSAAGYESGPYRVEVLPVPRLKALTLMVQPPAYTNIRPFETEAKMVQDVPEGSKVSWNLNLQEAESAVLVLDSAERSFTKLSQERFGLDLEVMENLTYSVKTANALVEKTNLSKHKLSVIKDAYPEISNRFNRDSTDEMLVYLSGNISDDYGFSKLLVVVDDGEKRFVNPINIDRKKLSQAYGHLLELDSLSSNQTKELKVFLEVYDNDGINGSKMARSQAYTVRLLGKEARKEKLEEQYQQFFGSKKQLSKDQEELEKSLQELQRQMMESKSLDWKKKEKLKELLKKQQQLLEKQQENEEMLEKLQREEEKLMEKPEELKEKEEQIKEISKEQKELEELMKDIEKLMEDLNMERLQEKLEKMEEINQQNRQANQRQEELLKDLKFQKDVLEQSQKLEELAEEMEKLSKDEMESSEEEQGSQEDSEGNEEQEGESEEGKEDDDFQKELEKQEEIKEEFDKAMEKLKELQEQNSSFKKSSEEQKMDQQQQDVNDEMQKAGENLQQQKSQPANQNQQKAGEQMQKMSESMQMSMMQMGAQSTQANIETLRQILENLEILSFGVEELADRTREVSQDDPVIKDILQEQKKLQDGAQVIEDSLVALSEKVPELKQVVFEELDDVKDNLDRAIQNLEELEQERASVNQQYVMTAANNLALLLDESLQNMMQMMSQMMPANQNCQKPGSGQSKPSMSMMRKLQNELGQKMQGMKEGQKEGKGKGRNGKEIVEMLSRQEQLRQMLEQMQEKGGDGNGNAQRAIEEMKKLEEDLLDGQLQDNYKERLQEIETRLLESEKAELEQKQDEKRESKTADDMKQLYREELKKYLEEKQNEKENLERVPLNFRHYYKGETTKYLKDL